MITLLSKKEVNLLKDLAELLKKHNAYFECAKSQSIAILLCEDDAGPATPIELPHSFDEEDINIFLSNMHQLTEDVIKQHTVTITTQNK